MWMGKQLARSAPAENAEAGTVSIGGAHLSAVCDGERRALTLYAPGGYCWAPAAGQAVLVLKSGAVLGAEAAPPDTLAPGEVLLYAPGGASICLHTDGSVDITGEVRVNGQPLPGQE